MLSGVKFISRDQLKKHNTEVESSIKVEKKSSRNTDEERYQDGKELARNEEELDLVLEHVCRSNAKAEDVVKPPTNEVRKSNPKELNPYLKHGGTGYPEDEEQRGFSGDQLFPTSFVGDGGASWRLKALKRAHEQAARDGRKLDEVVEERWGSVGELAVSLASQDAAPAHAHLHAIKNRKRGSTGEGDTEKKRSAERGREDRDYLQGARSHKMREPKVHESLSWRKRSRGNMPAEDRKVISEAAVSLNKFTNDGSFMDEVRRRQTSESASVECSTKIDSSCLKLEEVQTSKAPCTSSAISMGNKNVITKNQLAAKVLQLRMRGKHEEADFLLKEAETQKEDMEAGGRADDGGIVETSIRSVRRQLPSQQRKKEDDADAHLARKIVQDKQYSLSGRADDEYDFDADAPVSKKKYKNRAATKLESAENSHFSKHLMTLQERCRFCFENPARPNHLILSVAYFTYLMLPQLQSVVDGHCCILTKEHESATRSIDDNVWEEIRNFKKCLILMFAQQNKDVIFLETVIELAKQRRHCMIDCIPLPSEIATEAPVYFKKAIDESEEEWSQHNAKRLIDTGEKGLRGSIPKGFPYFHVEFGLKRGFVHVIEDEQNFKSGFGLNVIRGMLQLPEEDMYRRRKQESLETQKKAVASITRLWEPFDWTKQL